MDINENAREWDRTNVIGAPSAVMILRADGTWVEWESTRRTLWSTPLGVVYLGGGGEVEVEGETIRVESPVERAARLEAAAAGTRREAETLQIQLDNAHASIGWLERRLASVESQLGDALAVAEGPPSAVSRLGGWLRRALSRWLGLTAACVCLLAVIGCGAETTPTETVVLGRGDKAADDVSCADLCYWAPDVTSCEQLCEAERGNVTWTPEAVCEAICAPLAAADQSSDAPISIESACLAGCHELIEPPPPTLGDPSDTCEKRCDGVPECVVACEYTFEDELALPQTPGICGEVYWCCVEFEGKPLVAEDNTGTAPQPVFMTIRDIPICPSDYEMPTNKYSAYSIWRKNYVEGMWRDWKKYVSLIAKTHKFSMSAIWRASNCHAVPISDTSRDCGFYQ